MEHCSMSRGRVRRNHWMPLLLVRSIVLFPFFLSMRSSASLLVIVRSLDPNAKRETDN